MYLALLIFLGAVHLGHVCNPGSRTERLRYLALVIYMKIGNEVQLVRRAMEEGSKPVGLCRLCVHGCASKTCLQGKEAVNWWFDIVFVCKTVLVLVCFFAYLFGCCTFARRLLGKGGSVPVGL
jgi:hypothetical protein